MAMKQRKSLQSTNLYNTAEKYNYINDDLNRDYRLQAQTVPLSYKNRQRHSIGTISATTKNRYNVVNSCSKKTDKKYDYSVNIQNSFNREFLNKTHDRIRGQQKYHIPSRGQTQKVNFVVDEYDKRRSFSINENIPRNRYTDKKQTTERPIQLQSCKNSQIKQQKIEIKSYLKAYEPKYSSNQKTANKRYQIPINKQNNFIESRPLTSKNVPGDNFGMTDKLRQFTAQNRLHDLQESRNRTKYQPKYSRMRNNKRCQIIANQQQNVRHYIQTNEKNKKNSQPQEKPINFQNLFKDSQAQNTKIRQKINHISQLNQQINQRLQKMLHRNKNV